MSRARACMLTSSTWLAHGSQEGGEEVQLDSWLLDFASLFLQMTGLEPDK